MTKKSKQQNKVRNAPSFFVGIGASAGGLVALEEFFKNVPLETGIAFIVIQHLPPDHRSMMTELLEKHTELPIFIIEEGMAVEADCIYLIPPGKNVKIFHGEFLLTDTGHPKRLNLPIDIFLSSLAKDQGKKTIGIILSGTGSDGSRGIRHIKEELGVVIAQDEKTAQFDGMPRSAVETGIVDFILPPDKMIHKILSYIQHPFANKISAPLKTAGQETVLTRIFSILREKHMVDFTYYKQATILRRIERCMTINQIHEINDYVKLLESYPEEVTALFNELLIGVTRFFRDSEAFDYIKDKILPDLFSKADGRELRFWVEGCSTGEEAYSLAMLCMEYMESIGKSIRFKIFSTDVDKRSITYASEGIYPESVAAELSPKYLTKYFYRRENCFQVARNIREMVVFATHNLLRDPPFTKIDMIACRNLLIYFQPVLQKRAFEKFNFALNPGGILFLGPSESINDMAYYFEPLNHKWKIYRSNGKQIPAMGMPDRYSSKKYLSDNKIIGNLNYTSSLSTERLHDRLLQLFAERYISLVILVNDRNEILHVFGKPDKFLKFPEGRPVALINKVFTKDMVVPVTSGLQEVFKNKKPVKCTNLIIYDKSDATNANMEIHMLPSKAGEDSIAAIFIEEVEERSVAEENTIKEVDLNIEKRVEELENELIFTRESLQATIEELETSNEELGATNEELLASNEELQSTNEELQSVNEELYNVNAEYQEKNIELTEITNDLGNLFNNLKIPVLFLDENYCIRRFTHQISEIFMISNSDIGRSLDHIKHKAKDVDFSSQILNAAKFNVSYEMEICLNSNDWYLTKIHPYKVSKDITSGVIMIFININRQKKDELKLERFATVVMDSNDAITVHDFEGNISAWNVGAKNIYGFTETEALALNIRDIIPKSACETEPDYIGKIQIGEKVQPFKTKRITKNGNIIDVLITATQLNNEFGRPVAIATTERYIRNSPDTER